MAYTAASTVGARTAGDSAPEYGAGGKGKQRPGTQKLLVYPRPMAENEGQEGKTCVLPRTRGQYRSHELDRRRVYQSGKFLRPAAQGQHWRDKLATQGQYWSHQLAIQGKNWSHGAGIRGQYCRQVLTTQGQCWRNELGRQRVYEMANP